MNTTPSTTKTPNKLISEKSPYLLQHAYNPVSWYSWCNEAFEIAKKENKPIFLSIGYSTCHWCHVMEHESFEDKDVAKLLNENFISIKVDREERADLDNIYMTVCQMLTGSGGWPLTIIMTPDKKPFFAGTYFPKESKYGRIGMFDLLPRISELWKTKKDEAINSANEIISFLQQVSTTTPGEELSENELHNAFNQLSSRFDKAYGGFGESPKFPTAHNFLFLLRYWKKMGDARLLEMVEKTLSAMRLGGIYDHIGFGFHRYSTDREWLVPHFEKMLYDQAMISMAYIEAYQATKKEEYKNTACEIFEYVLRDMTSVEGGFYSAEDADSEGIEGKFYVWSEDKIKKILTKSEAELFIKVFYIEKGGNFYEEATREKTGANILHQTKERNGDRARRQQGEGEQLESIRKKLFVVREKRIHPYKDDKMLTDWNGLMIAALAKGAQAFNEPKYTDAARCAFNFIREKMQKNGRLLHRYRDGEAAILGNVDDYVFLIWGLIELYEATFDSGFLKEAIKLNDELIQYFWDDKEGGFYFTSSDIKDTIIRKKEIYDGAIPSGNSVAMLNLLRLYHMTQDEKLKGYALRLEKTFSNNIKETPMAYTQFLCGLDFRISLVSEIIISGNLKSEDTKEMIKAIRQEFIPSKVVMLDNEREMINRKATAYVCSNFTCKKPMTDINEIMELLKK